VTNTIYGGAIEYCAIALLVLQILFASVYLKGRWAVWPRAVFFGAIAVLIFFWSVTAAAVWLTLSGVMYYSRVVPLGLGTSIAALGYCWVILSTLAVAIGGPVRFLSARISKTYSPGRRRCLSAASLAVIGTPPVAFAFGALVERNQFGIRELDLPVPGLHPDLDGFRIVQVSDLHVSPFLSVRDAARVIDMANGLSPDLTVFTGDLTTELADPLDEAIRELVRLRAGYGVLGCMGNHEQYVRCQNYLERQAKRSGLVFLRGANTQIRRGQALLNIAGIDYQRNSKRANYLTGAERLVIREASNILLSHNPDVFPAAIDRGFQAVLSGHTHGGQVNVEILHQNVNPARFRTPFTSGLYRLGAPGPTSGVCFVTNGIGTLGVPIRLGAPPEIALLRLRRA
jgi:predicted MPP superfamily phosphohydrolase